MFTIEQAKKIHAHAHNLLAVCPSGLVDDVLSILEQVEGAVKAEQEFNEFIWKGHELFYKGRVVGRIWVYPSTYKCCLVDKHGKDKSLGQVGFLDYAKQFVKDAAAEAAQVEVSA